ncbi:MAG: acyl-CoA thioesterase [Trueperaceae bacterium]
MKPFLIEWHFPVRTYDIDFAQHVSNIVYIRWLEDLRLEMMNNYFPLAEVLSKGQAPVLRSTSIDYKQPIILSDKVRGLMWMSEMETTRMTLQAEFYKNDTLAATATQTGVFIDMQSKRPVKVPDALRERFQLEKEQR